MDSSLKMRLEGRMDDMTGRIKQAWGTLTDDDVKRAEGKWDRLVGVIKEKTGEAQEKIEEKISHMLDETK